MPDALLNIVKVNESIDYSLVIPFVIGYSILFWIIVCIWVFYDARKRFKNKKMAFLMALGNFIFQVPFLLLYLLFRPIEEDLSELGIQGGVNVPIVNFIGKDGIAMSLELKINNNSVIPQGASEMKIDVSFDSQDTNKSLVKPELKVEVIETTKKINFKEKINGLLTKLKTKLPKKVVKDETKKTEEKPKEKGKKKD